MKVPLMTNKIAKEIGGKHKNQDLNWVFSTDRDEHGKPYYQDGNPLLYSDENLKKRTDLKKDQAVVEAIQDFMNVFFKKNREGNYTKEEYQKVFLKIGMVLRPKDPSDKLQQKLIEEYDNEFPKNPEMLTPEQVYESLYSLCDIWCPNIDAQEYKEFFELMKFKLKYEGQSNAGAYGVI
eukprot:TRINITY_DN1630_c0_g3_i2.p1 TRINITY_DN1630_c0_g3~~TRINITY_DN1630_c0_g3_i2.p1  ORF type:complete len:179 (+),score=74.36 TRINITY_DN1630_c0_g3_i2:142-678(+)